MEVLKKIARKGAEIVIVALGTMGLEAVISARQGDWSTLATLLLMGLCWAGVVFGVGAIVRNQWKRSKAKKAAAAAEQRKEESLAKVFRMASVSALDLRRLYLRLHGEQIDIDDQDDPDRQSLVTRTRNLMKVFWEEYEIATPPLIDEKVESFNTQGWLDYLEELIPLMERGDVEGARRRFPPNRPYGQQDPCP